MAINVSSHKGDNSIICDIHPKKTVILRMLSSTHVETKPQKMRIMFLRRCRYWSHQTFSLGINVRSSDPIHDISSNKMTVGLSVNLVVR
jgi:hypothetical protein